MATQLVMKQATIWR